ncbi:uncharacterized protein LAJ45_10200 [Morchella importuna]|uniref:uncharacterized protein n=1 Tax=Morchella importuna TaxID=1174673 RepID=UPI001E8CC076|nr:uncharacterized protein LAJ45_10200 [Morchella importuna]KAH8145723.1 hypothetical protein LAJ45_10200 [Morchella importuna]
MPPSGPPPYIWGVHPRDQQYPRKRKAPLLDEMLVTFPDAKRLTPSTGNKYEDIVKYMRERHREQRQRLLSRHEREFKEWKEETAKCIDFEATYKYNFPIGRPNAIMLPESIDLISTPEARASLQRLPETRRNVVVSVEQLKVPEGLSEIDEYRTKQFSHPEFSAEIARYGVSMRKQMRREEQELRMYQNEAISIFFQALERNYPDKYAPTFGPYTPLADKKEFGSDIRRPPPPPPLSIPKVPSTTSARGTPQTGLFTSADGDVIMRDAPLPPKAGAASPALPSPGISRDPRKPPPQFDPYKMRVDQISPPNQPPSSYRGRGENPPHYNRRDESRSSNSYRRRDDPYSRRESIESRGAVAYSNKFKSPRSPSLRSPFNEHDRGYQGPRQESDRTGGQSPAVGRDGGGRGASPRNNNAMDSGETSYNRRSSMSNMRR